MAECNQKKASLLVLVAMVVLAVQVKSVVAAGDYTEAMMKVVREEVNAVNLPGNDARPGLIRLLFHDCFVNGCDGSVLLNSSRINGTDGKTEQASGFNIGLRGFGVIDKIKERLAEYKVTCTDALIYAAREAVYELSNKTIIYGVAGPGRMDGVISKSEDPGKHLPNTAPDFKVLVQKFTDKDFTEKDVVALSGAHAVGIAHSTTIDITDAAPKYNLAVQWEIVKDKDAVKNNVRDFVENPATPSGYKPNNVSMAAKGVLDNSFYNAVLQNMGLFPSDRVLGKDPIPKPNAIVYRDDAKTWRDDFGNAMARLSMLPAPKNAPSEIRKVCSKTN